MNTKKFCIPIIKKSKKEVLQTIKKYKAHYDYFEVWLDYTEDLDASFVIELERKLNEKLIILFRRQNLEKPKMSKKLKKEILWALNGKKALVDFDIISQIADVTEVKKEKLQLSLILSYHNYKQTPSDRKLAGILRKMKNYTPHIYKVSTFCTADNDAIRLLSILVQLKDEGKKCIILGMGNHGIYTRICGMMLGNEFSFAPNTLQEASAPGQLTRHELIKISGILEKR